MSPTRYVLTGLTIARSPVWYFGSMLVPCVVMYVAAPPRLAGRNSTTHAAHATTKTAVAALDRQVEWVRMRITSQASGAGPMAPPPTGKVLLLDLVAGGQFELDEVVR